MTITGKDVDGIITDDIEFYLADFRFDDNSQDYIIDTWTAVDLSILGQVKTIEFSVSSSDTGDYGINTPTYFAIDGIAIDRCPDDPDKIDAGICGCGVSDEDLDQDGTPDCNDECPDDPDKIDPGLCGCGTSDVDTDGDGVPDCEEPDSGNGFICFINLLGAD